MRAAPVASALSTLEGTRVMLRHPFYAIQQRGQRVRALTLYGAGVTHSLTVASGARTPTKAVAPLPAG